MSGLLDPSTATRAEFTHSYINILPPPPFAHPKWARLFKEVVALFKALVKDEHLSALIVVEGKCLYVFDFAVGKW